MFNLEMHLLFFLSTEQCMLVCEIEKSQKTCIAEPEPVEPKLFGARAENKFK